MGFVRVLSVLLASLTFASVLVVEPSGAQLIGGGREELVERQAQEPRDVERPRVARPSTSSSEVVLAGASTGEADYTYDLETGQTVWNGSDELATRELEDVLDIEGFDYVDDASTVVPDLDVPEGFVPGESVYLEEFSTSNAHAFLNPDGTQTVIMGTSDFRVDPQTGERLPEEITVSVEGDQLTETAGDTSVSVGPDRSKIADLVGDGDAGELASVVTPDGAVVLAIPGSDPNAEATLVELGPVGPAGRDVVGEAPPAATVDELAERDAAPDREAEDRAPEPSPESSVPGASAEPGPVTVDDPNVGAADGVLVEEVLSGVDVQIEPLADGFKTDYFVDSIEAAGSVQEQLTVPASWRAEQSDGAVVFFDGDDNVVGIWSGGSAFDATGESQASVSIELVTLEGGVAIADVVVDQEWLNADGLAFPIRIDPVYTAKGSEGGAEDTWIQDGSSANNAGSGSLNIGPLNGGPETRSLLRFTDLFDEFGSSAKGFAVASATLRLHGTDTPSCTPNNTVVRRSTGSWDQNSVNFSNQPTQTGTGQAVSNVRNGAAGCPGAYIDYDLTEIVQYWSNNPGSNYGVVVSSAGGGEKTFASSEHSNAANTEPLLVVDYETWGASYEHGVAGMMPWSTVLPEPGAGGDGVYPITVQNRGVLDWPAGTPVEQTSNLVCLSYHSIAEGAPQPPTSYANQGDWAVFDGMRSCPAANVSNLGQWVAANRDSQNPAPAPLFVPIWAGLRGSDMSVPGTRDVYFSMVHDIVGPWFEMGDRNPMLKQTIRWTGPPRIASPAPNATISRLDDLVFEIDPPYDTGQTGAWEPSSYQYEVTTETGYLAEFGYATDTSPVTVDREDLTSAFGIPADTLQICVRARDGLNETPGGPELWTRQSCTLVTRSDASYGASEFSEQFSGVLTATGNYHEAATDFATPGMHADFGLTRHLNTRDVNATIFGPGVFSNFNQQIAMSPAQCDINTPTADCDFVYTLADGSAIRMDRTAANEWTAINGSQLTGSRTGGKFIIESGDGSSMRFDNDSGLGLLDLMTDPRGHQIEIDPGALRTLDANDPMVITDVTSARTITIGFQSFTTGYPYRAVSASSDGDTWTYSYQNGFLHQACPPLGECTEYVWINGRLDEIRRPTWAVETDPDLRGLTEFTYDNVRRVLSVQHAPDPAVSFVYTSETETTITDAAGGVWVSEFDAQDRSTKLTQPGGTTLEYQYDGQGNRTYIKDPTGRVATFAYDSDGNLTSEIIGLSTTQSTGGEQTTYAYNDPNYDNAPSQRCDSRGFCTLFTYDADGNKLTETSPEGRLQEWVYTNGTEPAIGGGLTPAGLLKEHRNGDSGAHSVEGVTTYRYSSNGDLRRRTDPSGLITNFTYDSAGRMLTESITYANGTETVQTVSRQYDANSRVLTEDGPQVTSTVAGGSTHQVRTTYNYTENGQIEERKLTDLANNGAVLQTWTFAYDAADREISATDPEGHTVSTTYDNNGNVRTVTDARGTVTRTTYDALRNPERIEMLNWNDTGTTRLVNEFDYDAAGRQIARTEHRSATESVDHEYTYDLAGRLDKTRVFIDGGWVTVNDDNYTNGLLTETISGNTAVGPVGQDKSVTSYTYDNDGRIDTITVGDRQTTMSYTPAGNVHELQIAGTDQVTNNQTLSITRTVFDAAGRPIETVIENGASDIKTTTVYDERGLETGNVSPRGHEPGNTETAFTTYREYDEAGQLIRVQSPPVDIATITDPLNAAATLTQTTAPLVSEYRYDALGNQIRTVDPRGNVTATTYDANNRVDVITHPSETINFGTIIPTEDWNFDPNGNVASYTDRDGDITNYFYDDANRVIRQVDPQIPVDNNDAQLQPAGEHLTTYDFQGNIANATTPEGAYVSFDYDELGRLEQSDTTVRAVADQQAMTVTETYAHSWLGFQTTQVDGEGVTTTTTYDQHGQIVTSQVGNLPGTSYLYNGLGDVRRTTTGDGTATETAYDLAGRPTSTTEYQDDGVTVIRTVTNTYDHAGNLETTTSGRGGTTGYTYDALNRIVSADQQIDDTDSIVTSYAYDQASNLTVSTDADGNDTLATFNAWNLQTFLVEPAATPGEPEADRRWEYRHNAAGQVTYERQPGNRIIQRSYNNLGLLETENSTATGSVASIKSIGYDRNGRATYGSHPTAPIVFVYDDRGLLVEQTGGAGDTTTIYDDAGRPETITDEAGTRTYTYNPTNGLVESITDGTPPAGGGGGGAGSAGPYDILMIVGNPNGLNTTETNIKNHLEAEGHTLTLRDNQLPEVTDPTVLGHLVLIAHVGYLGNKYEDTAVPTINLFPSRWDDHELTTSGPAGSTSSMTVDILDDTHPLAGGLSGTVTVLNYSPRNMDYVTAAQLDPANPPAIVADVVTAGHHVLIGYEPGDTLTDGSTAPNYRVGLGGFNKTNSHLNTNGHTLLDAAIDWVTPGTGGSNPPPSVGGWSETYDYDNAGRLETTTYGDGGIRTIGYDDAGRMNADVITNASAVETARTEYLYSCDHELIAKNIIDLDNNTGEGLNVYTYDHAGRLTSWDDNATALPSTCPTSTSGGGGSGGGGGAGRVAGPVAEYHFASSDGTTVADITGNLDLTVNDPANVTVGTTGLTINTETEIISSLAASHVINEVTSSDEITMEAWVDPASLTQTGPARILSISSNAGSRNATLGQQNSGIDWRTRATNTGNNGVPSLGTGNGAITTDMTHVVATFDANGDREIWIDGVLDSSGSGAGQIAAWDNSMKLVIGNEANGNREWLGEICLAAVYSTALTPAEIAQNYTAGCPTGGGSNPPPPSGNEWTLAGEIYTYDERGNRLTAGGDSFTYDNRNRLLTDPDGSYAWNPDGTLDAYTPNTGPVEDYTFDAAGRLTDITNGTNSTSYAYDSLDRIAERDGDPFTYNGAQWDPTSDGTDTFHRTTGGGLLAYQDTTGVSHAVGNNHRDLTALVAADGTLTDTATYNPWGDPIDATGTTNPVLGYQSDYTDPDTEHVWMGTRWYQPTTGTFLSRDTYAGELSTPLSLNRYTYAVNNPVNRWDPDGRCSMESSGELVCGNGSKKTYIDVGGGVNNGKTFKRDCGEPGQMTCKDTYENGWTYTIQKYSGGKSSFDVIEEAAVARAINEARSTASTATVAATPGLLDGIDYTNWDLSDIAAGGAAGLADSVSGFAEAISGVVGFFGGLITDPGETWNSVVEKTEQVTEAVNTLIDIVKDGDAAIIIEHVLLPLIDINLDQCRERGLDYCLSRAVGANLDMFIGGAGAIDAFADINRTLDAIIPDGIATATSVTCGLLHNSFSGDTEVLMADGTTKPIAAIEPGDMIWAADPETGEAGPRAVTHLWVHTDTLTDFNIGDHTVTTTEDHPFWNHTDQQWQDAQDFDPGDLVLTNTGRTIPTNGLDHTTAYEADAFNLSVNNIHTYHVNINGQTVLVHNTNRNRNDCDGSGGSAEQLATDYAAGLNGSANRPTMATAAVDRTTGDVFYGTSGEYSVRPAGLEDGLPNPSMRPWSSANCGEVSACASAMANGSDLSDLDVATVRVSNGEPEPPCRNCASWLPLD